MTHTVRNKKTYGVLPHHKYSLSNREPSEIMDDSSYTIFCKVKFLKQDTQQDGGVLTRPGQHSGFFFSNDHTDNGGFVKYTIWVTTEDGDKPIFKDIHINKDEIDKFHLIHATYDKGLGLTEVFLNGELKYSFNDSDYKGKISYSNEPYFIGSANPFAPEEFQNYGNFEYEYVGLIDKVVTKQEIEGLKHITIKHDRHGLNVIDPKEDISKHVIFYFDFENISRYRVWDVSNNSNHLNIHVHKLSDEEIEEKINLI